MRITRVALEAHGFQTFLHMISAFMALTCESTKTVRFENRTDMVNTSLNVAKIQV